MKKASVVYNFLAIWLVWGVSTVIWTLIYHGDVLPSYLTNKSPCRFSKRPLLSQQGGGHPYMIRLEAVERQKVLRSRKLAIHPHYLVTPNLKRVFLSWFGLDCDHCESLGRKFPSNCVLWLWPQSVKSSPIWINPCCLTNAIFIDTSLHFIPRESWNTTRSQMEHCLFDIVA